MTNYLILTYLISAFLVTGIVAYLTEECLDTCNKHDHNKHKIAALLLFFSPLWGIYSRSYLYYLSDYFCNYVNRSCYCRTICSYIQSAKKEY